MRKLVMLLLTLAVLFVTPAVFAADHPAGVAAPAPAAEQAAPEAAIAVAPGPAAEAPATRLCAAETSSLMAQADFSCLVCWRASDCNSYCGGPWGVCQRGCCACTM